MADTAAMDPDQLFSQAQAHHQANRLDEADALYREVLEQHPQHHDAWHMRGIVALQEGRHQEAVERISEALRLEPAYVAAHCNLGLAQMSLGRREAARTSFARALDAPSWVVDGTPWSFPGHFGSSGG